VLRLSPNVTIQRAYFERLDDEHWIANVAVRHEDLTRDERLLFALDPGYDPMGDGGFEAAAQITEFLKEVT
jgi:hypothetical protein